jgi:uncharacterized protein YndB with AHSA1/START domain
MGQACVALYACPTCRGNARVAVYAARNEERPMSDRIEKKILLRATPRRVWQALTDAREFGSWFGMALDGPFRPGAPIRGVIVPTTVDPDVAKTQEPYRGTPVEMMVEQMQPERLFSFRWHPFAIDRTVDYSSEPTTLIEFTLAAVPDGTMLTLVESGFDQIPIGRRAKAFTANDRGWAAVMQLLERYLAHAA